MIFLVIVPILAGFGNFLVPLMIGARDMAFPRLNALSYWLYLLGGIVLYLSFFAKGGAAQTGWTAYVPLSTLHAPGRGQDLWILGLHILSISSLAGAINFIVTIHNMRARGMTWMRIPLFVWAILTYAWLLVIVLPTLSAGLTMMLLDRQAGTHFFDPAHGGSPMLYQHVFWFFGHPEVYIMILPAMGMSRRSSRSSRASRSSATRRSRGRPSGSRSSRCSSGPTTCSRSACRSGSTRSS